MDTTKPLNALLCSNCGKKIGEVSMKDGKVVIKCKCGTINTVETKPAQIATSDRRIK